jgi:hypothetical protein
MSIAAVTLAGAIQWLGPLAMIRLSATATAAAERCQLWPRTGLALVDVSEWCSSVARRMLRE